MAKLRAVARLLFGEWGTDEGTRRAGCEEELEDIGVKVHQEETNGEGGCDGERKFKKRAEVVLRDLGKVWLPDAARSTPLLTKPSVNPSCLMLLWVLNFPEAVTED